MTCDVSFDNFLFMPYNHPKFIFDGEGEIALSLMKCWSICSVPIVNSEREIIDVVFCNDEKRNRENYHGLENTPIVIMAGGKGTRLYPFTKILPKPLIPIGDVPILERIINRFNSYGANDFYLTVNYKKEMIKSYIKELAPDYSITYVEEDKPLGTAGSIKLIDIHIWHQGLHQQMLNSILSSSYSVLISLSFPYFF